MGDGGEGGHRLEALVQELSPSILFSSRKAVNELKNEKIATLSYYLEIQSLKLMETLELLQIVVSRLQKSVVGQNRKLQCFNSLVLLRFCVMLMK
jgi:hypothetical protein